MSKAKRKKFLVKTGKKIHRSKNNKRALKLFRALRARHGGKVLFEEVIL